MKKRSRITEMSTTEKVFVIRAVQKVMKYFLFIVRSVKLNVRVQRTYNQH